jgi:uncharacterized protein (DUF58 family)
MATAAGAAFVWALALLLLATAPEPSPERSAVEFHRRLEPAAALGEPGFVRKQYRTRNVIMELAAPAVEPPAPEEPMLPFGCMRGSGP